jgi:transposase
MMEREKSGDKACRHKGYKSLAITFLSFFENLEGFVPNKIWFDQLAAACAREKSKDGHPIIADRFLRFATHYGFEPVFCNPYSGHEKRNAEKKVGDVF